MSADNGIYVLKTGHQYRVAHLRAIENLYWNKKDRCMENKMQPARIIEMFGGCKFTNDANVAINVANMMLNSVPYAEYGIVVLDAHMNWKQILEEVNHVEEF